MSETFVQKLSEVRQKVSDNYFLREKVFASNVVSCVGWVLHLYCNVYVVFFGWRTVRLFWSFGCISTPDFTLRWYFSLLNADFQLNLWASRWLFFNFICYTPDWNTFFWLKENVSRVTASSRRSAPGRGYACHGSELTNSAFSTFVSGSVFHSPWRIQQWAASRHSPHSGWVSGPLPTRECGSTLPCCW